jgi:hypothetical protein
MVGGRRTGADLVGEALGEDPGAGLAAGTAEGNEDRVEELDKNSAAAEVVQDPKTSNLGEEDIWVLADMPCPSTGVPAGMPDPELRTEEEEEEDTRTWEATRSFREQRGDAACRRCRGPAGVRSRIVVQEVLSEEEAEDSFSLLHRSLAVVVVVVVVEVPGGCAGSRLPSCNRCVQKGPD